MSSPPVDDTTRWDPGKPLEPEAELRRTVGLLLSTQQELIDLRNRRDRERRVLDGIVGFSQRVLPAGSSDAFWASVVDAATVTFDCEISLALQIEDGHLRLLAGRGPQPGDGPEQEALARLLEACGNPDAPCPGNKVEAAALADIRFRGAPIATLLWAPMGRADDGAQAVLAIALSERKRAFFHVLDEGDLSGLTLFASHVGVIHEMHRSRQRIAEQVVELDHTNTALELRMLEQQRSAEERERLRAQLAQARRMESIGRLAGGVAHDFNNLLLVINGNAGLLQMEPDLDPELRQCIAEISEAGNRASALTQQLLMFSRRQVIRPTRTDLNTLLTAALRLYRRLIGEDIELTLVPCLEDAPVLADPQQFEQLLGNLLANARDAVHAVPESRRRSEIHVRTRIVQTESPLPGRAAAVRIDVQDFGIGMDEESRQNIFEPFFTTKTIGHGAGLGLATVLGIIEQNHGLIEVTSAPGEGTTFTVYWPLAAPASGEWREQSRRPEHGSATARVWLVEDEDQVRRFIVRGLERLGFAVTAFPAGQAVLEHLDAGVAPPDILVTDVVMPQMNGRQLAEAVNARMPELPVLFVSGYTDDIIAQHGVVRGGVALLEKPFTPAELGRKIQEVLAAAPTRAPLPAEP